MASTTRIRGATVGLSGPARTVLGFALAALLGGLLLSMSFSGRAEHVPFIDALFTSTSAVCVTGLSTIDVGQRLTPAGQGILLGLIQLGGLGITTVSTFLLLTAGRATLGHALGAGESLAAVRVQPLRLIWWVVGSTLAIEACGAVLLLWRFEGDGAAWSAVFHSVSAFCNAGFSLNSDNLTGYRSDPVVLTTVSVLIMTGGIGFIVLRQVALWGWSLLRGRRFPLFLHSRVVLLANAMLWLLGGAMFLGLERNALLSDESFLVAAGNAMFHSISARTAGFNSVDLAFAREPTLFLMMFLMLIGASPGSCGGGMKVTTVSVILATMFARLRGVETVTLLRRTVPPATVQRSFLLLSIVLALLTLIVTGLLFAEEAAPAAVRADRLTVLSFEAVSAFGTVGLSAGVTPTLTTAGKLLIIVAMFVGRVGPLVVALAILRPRSHPSFAYPLEELAIG
ncbi:MAG: Potassium/sodium uptake protein NtpJ [Phycisphaerae bacterium]|nr:Potassium/sodium uptake protein NtpJ [Phycisphaerae bacterium]